VRGLHETRKIATCSYCGVRTVLSLAGSGRHELAWANCGAPLHEMKALKTDAGKPDRPKKAAKGERHSGVVPRAGGGFDADRRKSKSKSKSKKKKRGFGWFVAEAFDELTDIFD